MPTYVNIGLGSAETLWDGGRQKWGGVRNFLTPQGGVDIFSPLKGGSEVLTNKNKNIE